MWTRGRRLSGGGTHPAGRRATTEGTRRCRCRALEKTQEWGSRCVWSLGLHKGAVSLHPAARAGGLPTLTLRLPRANSLDPLLLEPEITHLLLSPRFPESWLLPGPPATAPHRKEHVARGSSPPAAFGGKRARPEPGVPETFGGSFGDATTPRCSRSLRRCVSVPLNMCTDLG